MKKILLGTIFFASVLFANSTTLSYSHSKKDFENSMTKKDDAKVKNINISHKVSNHLISLGYQSDNVNRQHSITNAILPSLDIEKYNAKYIYSLNKNLKLKANYVKIIDNLAPTDQGKIYGLGAKYNLSKGLNIALDFYRSDYDKFNVNQYDLSLSKGFKFDKLKVKTTIIAKKIDIDGNKYGGYTFVDKDYFITGLKLGANYNSYYAGVGAFFGKRIFSILDDGTKVQHHAMEQDKTYMLKLGKKFKDFDFNVKYSFQNGKELPENRDDVDTKVVSFNINYTF